MTKTLQKKFIGTAMIAITVLIVLLLGTINVLNAVRVSQENDELLDMLVRNREMRENRFLSDAETTPPELHSMGDATLPEGDEFGRPGRGGLFNPDFKEDDIMAARYFTVRVSSSGKVLSANVSNISSVEEDAAAEYAGKVLEKGKEEGRLSHFKYRITDARNGEKDIVFVDVSRNLRSILAVLLISVGIGIAAELLMLLLVILLSKKAIRPIAENIERQKQFVTDAGHEIKTPLAIIQANTDAMELHNGETKWSKNIRTQTKRLSGLMKDMLMLARTDEGTLQVTMAECEVGKLVAETVHAFKEPAKLKGIAIEKDIDETLSMVASKDQIIQLVSLLMDNAVKYSHENETINVKLSASGKGVKLKVSNVCDDMDEETVNKLFDRFYRGDAARTQKGGGYGIGLSVARAICEGHKGSIKATYSAPRITITAVLGERKKA